MLIKISFLGETLITAYFMAFKRSFTSVNSQVVKEIMPLSKIHVTILMIAIQNLYISLSTWIFIFKYFEFPCIRDFFIYFNRIKIEILPKFNIDLGTVGYFFSNLWINNLGFENNFLGIHAMLFIGVISYLILKHES